MTGAHIIYRIYIYIYIYIYYIFVVYKVVIPHRHPMSVFMSTCKVSIYIVEVCMPHIYIYIYILYIFFGNLLVLFGAGRLAQHEFGIVWPRVGCCSVAFVLWHMLFTYCFDSDSGLYWFCYSCSRRSACVGLRTRLIITIFLVDDLALQGLARKAVSAGLCSQIHL